MKSSLPIESCNIAYGQNLIGGKWKAVILWKLLDKRMRFSELRRSLPSIAESVLIAQLKELETSALVTRISYNTVPPHVEYEVTELGRSLRKVFAELEVWGSTHREQKILEDSH